MKNPPPSSRPEHQSVIVATNKIVQEFAEMLALVTAAAVDNAISPQESQEIRDRWESVKSATEQYVENCENS